MRNPLVVDGRNHLDAAAMRAAGFAYEGMGRAASSVRGAAGDARADAEALPGLAENGGDRPGGREGRAPRRRAGGRPKSLVDVAGKPLVAYQIGRLADAGVGRVIVSCAAGQGEVFRDELGGLGVEIVCAEEPERLGRGGGIKFAAQERARERRRASR